MGGLGATFVACLLRIAEYGKDPIEDGVNKICKYGSCHFVDNVYLLHDNFSTDVELFNLYIDAIDKKSHNKALVYATHVRDINLLSDSVDKIINLYCDENDITDISKIFVWKNIPDYPDHNVNLVIANYNYYLKNYNYIKQDNILNISWKEMLYMDLSLLIPKIEEFSGIKNISKEFFEEWRKRTLEILYIKH